MQTSDWWVIGLCWGQRMVRSRRAAPRWAPRRLLRSGTAAPPSQGLEWGEVGGEGEVEVGG